MTMTTDSQIAADFKITAADVRSILGIDRDAQVPESRKAEVARVVQAASDAKLPISQYLEKNRAATGNHNSSRQVTDEFTPDSLGDVFGLSELGLADQNESMAANDKAIIQAAARRGAVRATTALVAEELVFAAIFSGAAPSTGHEDLDATLAACRENTARVVSNSRSVSGSRLLAELLPGGIRQLLPAAK